MGKQLVLAFLILFMAGCGVPKPKEVTDSITKTKSHIEHKNWAQAKEETKNADDYFNLIRYKYEKKASEQFVDHLDKLEKDLAILSESKSLKEWEEVSSIWNKMN